MPKKRTKSKRFDVITMGSATVDVFGTMNKKFSQPKPGDKVLVTEVDFEIGGGGINSAAAIARMGLKTAFLGKLGNDHNADKIISELKKEKVTFMKTKPSKDFTSYSYILNSEKEKDRIIFTYKGASDHLSWNEVPKTMLKQTEWIYMATMMKQSFKTSEKVAAFAKKNKIKLLFNPSTYLAAKGKKYLKKILSATTLLVLNKSEAKLLLNTKSNDICKIMNDLRKLGPKMVVVTQGTKPMHSSDGKHNYSMMPYDVPNVSTAGCGDAFTSGFLAGLIHHDSIPHALELGMANASSVLQYYGTKNKLLSYNQARKFVRKHKEHIKVSECHP